MKVGYVALIGRPNVGKSTLLNKILGQKVAIISDKPQTTRMSIIGIKTTENGQIIFVDNPGIHRPLHRLNKRMMNFVYSALETSDLICLLIDATLRYGHGDQFVIDTLKKVSTPLFLLINKVDIVKKEKIQSTTITAKDIKERYNNYYFGFPFEDYSQYLSGVTEKVKASIKKSLKGIDLNIWETMYEIEDTFKLFVRFYANLEKYCDAQLPDSVDENLSTIDFAEA